MTPSNTTVPRHEVGIRISTHGILSREAEYDHAISPSDIREVFVHRSLLSPLALVMPVISLIFGLAILFLFLRPPSMPWWVLFLVVLFIGYALHTVWYFCHTRRHIIFLVVPTIAPRPIRFYITECAEEAGELVTAIRAVVQRGDSRV